MGVLPICLSSCLYLPLDVSCFLFLWGYLCLWLRLTRLLHILYSVNNKIWLCGQNQIITLKLVLKWKCAEGEGSDMEKDVKKLFWLRSGRELREWREGEKNKDKISIIFLFSFLGYWTDFKLPFFFSNLDKFWNGMSFWNSVETLHFDSSIFFFFHFFGHNYVPSVTWIHSMFYSPLKCFFSNNFLFMSAMCAYCPAGFFSMIYTMNYFSKA